MAENAPETTNKELELREARRREAEERRERQRLSKPFSMPPIAMSRTGLNQDEVDFFKTNGFLIKEALLENKIVGTALDRAWQQLTDRVPANPSSDWRIDRADRSSWRNPRWAKMQDPPTEGPFEGRQPIAHHGATVKIHDVGADPFFVDLLPNHPSVREIGTALLGDLRENHRTRGLYALFPTDRPGEAHGRELGPHSDRVCQQLNICAYLDDVRPRNGGFTVYPGSHRRTFKCHETESNWSPRAGFGTTLAEIAQTIEPWELVAPAGSVIFWHGRTVHSGGIHRGDDIRWALFGDYQRDEPVLSDDAHRAVGQYEWFKDTRLVENDAPVPEDVAEDAMWNHWRLDRIDR